jgi:cyanosortase A-associated protein
MTSQTSTQWLRKIWVASISMAGLVVLFHAILLPQKRNLLLGQRPYQFPAQVSLPGWQQQQSQSLKHKIPQDVLSAYEYQYQGQGKFRGKLVQAQIFYLRYIEGNVSRYLNLYTPVKSTLGQQQIFQPQTGYATLVVSGQQAYLGSCINPKGASTITETQFAQNRYQHDLTPSRILLWGLGQQDLIDRRCLFTALSVKIDNRPSSAGLATHSMPSEAQQILQEFWQHWHSLWQAQFPPS